MTDQMTPKRLAQLQEVSHFRYFTEAESYELFIEVKRLRDGIGHMLVDYDEGFDTIKASIVLEDLANVLNPAINPYEREAQPAPMTPDHITRAAKVIADFNACGHCEGTCGACRGEAEALAAAGLLVSPEHDAAVAARALREAAEVFDGGLPRRGIDDSWREAGTNYIRGLRERADRIEREAGESGAER